VHATTPPYHEVPQLEPDLAEVLQEEAPLSCLPVRIEGTARVLQLPYDRRTGKTLTVDNTKFVPLLTADPYRAFAEITSFDQDMILAYNRQPTVGDPNTERVPKGVTKRITARSEVWVMAYTSTSSISVGQERWAQQD
jgi:hypothetical protein